MALFKISKIIDWNTIQVQNGWTWRGSNGSFVRLSGYNASNEAGKAIALTKLRALLEAKDVELKNATEIIPYNNDNAVVCRVYLDGIDISQYFPELKTT